MHKTKVCTPCTPSLVKVAFTRLCKAIDTKRAHEVAVLTDLEISRLSVDPSSYSDAESFRIDYLLVNYLSKYKGLKTGIDTEAEALCSFAAAEKKCKETNVRLLSRRPVLVDPVIHRAKDLIATLLGPFSLVSLHGKERWGPGATFEFTRTKAYTDTKIAELPFTVTRNALCHFKTAIETDLHWSECLLGVQPSGKYSLLRSCFDVVEGSRITTVPKNAKTDRTIAVEPRGNMFLQKAVGTLIRSRLKRVGVNLDDQAINQKLAKLAYRDNLSTVDLKAASDTISTELIWQLLPFEWAEYLDTIRSRRYTLDGRTFVPFEKFSSMGNGFTFELESLIFWSLTRAVTESSDANGEAFDDSGRVQRTCAVYGDDIICKRSDAHHLITVLAYLGFDTNASKTFIEGNFFESCGKHYFRGLDVTPIYQKEEVVWADELAHIRFHNRLVNYALAHIDHSLLKEACLSIAAFILHPRLKGDRRIPFLPAGAEGNDGYLVSMAFLLNRERVTGRNFLRLDRNRGWLCPVRRLVRNTLPCNELAMYAYQLRINDSSEPLREGYHLSRIAPTGVASSAEFIGDLESRQTVDVQSLKWGERWVFPKGFVANPVVILEKPKHLPFI